MSNGEDVNHALLKAGLAWHYKYYALFRDDFITEYDVDSDPGYNVVITDEAMLLDGQTAIYNNLTNSSFNLNVNGQAIKVDYTIKGNNMTWKSVELNKKIEYNGTVYTTIPKQVSTVTLTRK